MRILKKLRNYTATDLMEVTEKQKMGVISKFAGNFARFNRFAEKHNKEKPLLDDPKPIKKGFLVPIMGIGFIKIRKRKKK